MDLTHLTSAELVFGSEVEGTDPQLRSERSPLFSAQLSKLIRLGVAAGNGPPAGRDFPSGQGSTTGINLLATGSPFPEGNPTTPSDSPTPLPPGQRGHTSPKMPGGPAGQPDFPALVRPLPENGTLTRQAVATETRPSVAPSSAADGAWPLPQRAAAPQLPFPTGTNWPVHRQAALPSELPTRDSARPQPPQNGASQPDEPSSTARSVSQNRSPSGRGYLSARVPSRNGLGATGELFTTAGFRPQTATRSPSQVGQELPQAGASDQGKVPNTSQQSQAPDSGPSAATSSSVGALKPATAHAAASPPPQVAISKPSLALSNGPTESATIAAQQVESGAESQIRPPVHLPKISINPDAPDAGPEVAQQRSNTLSSKQDKTPVSAERPAPVKSGSSPRPEASGLPRMELPGIRGETPHNRAPGSSLPQQTPLSGDGGREGGLRNPQAKVEGSRPASLQVKDSSPPPPLREAGKPFFQIAARTHYQHSGEAETTTVLENAPPASAPSRHFSPMGPEKAALFGIKRFE